MLKMKGKTGRNLLSFLQRGGIDSIIKVDLIYKQQGCPESIYRTALPLCFCSVIVWCGYKEGATAALYFFVASRGKAEYSLTINREL
ncbi:hypothetical protein [Alkalicoccus daliensis]|uniref:hypothetical protein n=1 Tax=Alkalicoccus daliensis TaxID=745820 RepID=UPI000B880C76|nr:hypothetical protein [Alkalicoccus daliensis]